jgi:hypothetical protein
VDSLLVPLSKQSPTINDAAAEQQSRLAPQGNALPVKMTTACQKGLQLLEKTTIKNRNHNNSASPNHTMAISPVIGRQFEINKITTQNANVHSGTTSSAFQEEALHESGASRFGSHQQLWDTTPQPGQASSYQLSPLIRPLVSKATRNQEESQKFHQQAAVCAKAMRRMLYISEPVEAGGSRSMASCSPIHCEESQSGEKNNQGPMTAVDHHRILPIDPMQVHAIHKRTLQQGDTATSNPYHDSSRQSILSPEENFSVDNDSTENLKLFGVQSIREIDLV